MKMQRFSRRLKFSRLNLCPKNKFMNQDEIKIVGNKKEKINKVKNDFKKGEIIIYKTSKNEVRLEVRMEKETVWLGARQIALLFDVNRPAIVKHINNIYKTGELEENSTCSILEQVATDGKIRKMNLYNLDAIISVGYRVNSKKATQFRVWATKTLKKHLVEGYTINEKRLLQANDKFRELQTTIGFLREKAKHELLIGQEQEILNLLASYSNADGNKRIGSFLFVYFLDRNKYLYRESGEKKINDNALIALALLAAVSVPEEKDKLIKIITNLLAE